MLDAWARTAPCWPQASVRSRTRKAGKSLTSARTGHARRQARDRRRCQRLAFATIRCAVARDPGQGANSGCTRGKAVAGPPARPVEASNSMRTDGRQQRGAAVPANRDAVGTGIDLTSAANRWPSEQTVARCRLATRGRWTGGPHCEKPATDAPCLPTESAFMRTTTDAGRTIRLMDTALTAALPWISDLLRRTRPSRPPEAGVREPRRPRPTLPAAAIALAEPRTEVRRWIRLGSRRGQDRRTNPAGRCATASRALPSSSPPGRRAAGTTAAAAVPRRTGRARLRDPRASRAGRRRCSPCRSSTRRSCPPGP